MYWFLCEKKRVSNKNLFIPTSTFNISKLLIPWSDIFEKSIKTNIVTLIDGGHFLSINSYPTSWKVELVEHALIDNGIIYNSTERVCKVNGEAMDIVKFYLKKAELCLGYV